MSVSERALHARVVHVAPHAPITLLEASDVDAALNDAIARGLPAPYGAVLWSSAVCMSSSIVDDRLRGKRVLEIGCGAGLVALLAARFAAHVLATDVDDGVLTAVARAAHMQGLHVDTANFDVMSDHALPPHDVMLCADLLYESPLARALARRCVQSLASGARVVVGDPGRLFRADLVRDLESAGVRAQFVDVTATDSIDGKVHHASLAEVQR